MLGSAIRDRRERLGLSFHDVAALSGLSREDVEAAEGCAELPLSVLLVLSNALVFDPAALLRGEPLSDPRRMPGWFRSHFPEQREAVSPQDARVFARAAELGEIGTFLLEILNRGMQDFERLRVPEALGDEAPWNNGYRLGSKDRTRLVGVDPSGSKLVEVDPSGSKLVPGLGPVEPLRSVQHVLENLHVHVALVQLDALGTSAVSIYKTGAMPVVLLNLRSSRCRSRMSRRAVLAHELCHLLHDTGEQQLAASDVLAAPLDEALEQRANGYAPAFLAPPEHVRRDIQTRGLSEPYDICTRIARFWGLSAEGALYHAKNCKLITQEAEDEILGDRSWRLDEARRNHDFELELVRDEPGEHGIEDAEVSNLAAGLLQSLVLDAHDRQLITEGRAREILEIS